MPVVNSLGLHSSDTIATCVFKKHDSGPRFLRFLKCDTGCL